MGSRKLPPRLGLPRLLWSWRRHGDPWIHHYFGERSVLDVGCGEGGLLERAPLSHVGIDVSFDLLMACRAKGLRVVCASAAALPLRDESFDAIHCDNVIEHLAPPQAAAMLSEFGRVLRPGGVAIVRSPLGDGVWNTFSHVRPYPPAAIRKLLADAKESFVRPGVSHLARLRLEHVYYAGRWSPVRARFVLSAAWAHYVPWARKHGYVAVLARK